MKRLLFFGITFALILTLAACSGGATESSSGSDQNSIENTLENSAKNSIEGVWTISEVIFPDGTSKTIDEMATTDEEKSFILGFLTLEFKNDGMFVFVDNTGTYSISDKEVVIKGFEQTFPKSIFTLDGNELIVTDFDLLGIGNTGIFIKTGPVDPNSIIFVLQNNTDELRVLEVENEAPSTNPQYSGEIRSRRNDPGVAVEAGGEKIEHQNLSYDGIVDDYTNDGVTFSATIMLLDSRFKEGYPTWAHASTYQALKITGNSGGTIYIAWDGTTFTQVKK